MAFRDLLFQTCDIKSTTYDGSGRPVFHALYASVPTRVDPSSSRLIVDKNGRQITATNFFFFDYSDVQTIEPDYLIVFNSKNYIVILADLLSSLDSFHHWEVATVPHGS